MPKTEIETWDGRAYLRFPIHYEIRDALEAAASGLTNVLIHGRAGVGKTTAVREEMAELRTRAMANDPGGYSERTYVHLTASRAEGTKTALQDIHREIADHVLSAHAQKHTSPRAFVDQIAEAMITNGTRLLCIDEAQMIDERNLDLVRQIPDITAEKNHPLGLILVGTPPLRNALANIGQLGQRFGREIPFPEMKRSEITKYLETHPALADLKATLEAKAWKGIAREILDTAQGTFRRLTLILSSIERVSDKLSRPVDREVVRLALGSIADEA